MSLISREKREIYEFSTFRLDIDERTIERVDGHPLDKLPEKTLQILALLVRRRGHLVTKDEILDQIWPDTVVEENNVEKRISYLRQFLGKSENGKKFIETVRGSGYRFVGRVEVVEVSKTWLPETLRLPDSDNRRATGDDNDAATNASELDREVKNKSAPPETGTGIFGLSKRKAVLACGVIGAATLASVLGFSTYFNAGSTAAAAIDPTFGNGGIVGDDAFQFEAVAIQPDGKIVVVSFVGDYPNYNIAVYRYNSDGSRDTRFDGDGKVTTDIGGRDAGHAVALQPDGKILVGANSVSDSGSSFVVVRYNSDGSLDRTFDGDGTVTTYIGGEDAAHSIAVQPDGKILVAGKGRSSGGLQDFVLVRYNSNGSLDSGFDGDGIVITDLNGSSDTANSVALQPNGKAITSGTGDGLFALVRYNLDGSLDTSFDEDGKVTTGAGVANSVAVQPDGKIIAAGSSANAIVLRRYNSNGSLDTSFADNGSATISLQTSAAANTVVLMPDGKIVIAGSATRSGFVNSSLVVARFNSNGSRDKTFGEGGIAVIEGDREQNRYSGVSAAVDTEGRIVVAGGAPSAAVYRFLWQSRR